MATKTEKQPARSDGRASSDFLHSALEDLTKARADLAKAGERGADDARAAIESAIERTRAALKDAGEETQDQLGSWQRSLERATDDLRRELGVLAVRAQRSPDALRAMSAEIRKRKAEISPSQ
jgi:hypothetical protein